VSLNGLLNVVHADGFIAEIAWQIFKKEMKQQNALSVKKNLFLILWIHLVKLQWNLLDSNVSSVMISILTQIRVSILNINVNG
jgi:hypothetical protein